MAEDEQRRQGIYSVGIYPGVIGGAVDPYSGNAAPITNTVARVPDALPLPGPPIPAAPKQKKDEPVSPYSQANIGLDPGGTLINQHLLPAEARPMATRIQTAALTGGISEIDKAVRVICTELVRQGRMEVWLLAADAIWSRANISHITARGYHWWALPYSRWMRRSSFATRAAENIAIWRAKELAYRLGVLSYPCWRGKLVRWIFEPLCWAIGIFTPETELSEGYRGGARWHEGLAELESLPGIGES